MGKLLDEGGARVRREQEIEDTANRFRLPPSLVEDGRFGPKQEQPVLLSVPAAEVVFEVFETHDGEECDCITGRHTILQVGDEITLTHTCHDGRVDKVVAKVMAIQAPTPIAPEHAEVSVSR